MKIRQIELNGFKSFSDRTVLALHDGVTVIVGPNGCGKSNVVDAFRWVLGEQSAKSLRGEKMDEVIFQGSAARKPKGMAEVTLSISMVPEKRAAEGNGGDDAAEDKSQDSVAVSRRLYRSGESDYLINKRTCRLKDIRDLFLDTGLDVKSYSILDQGRIGEILNSKPSDRRFLIEEVAGVMKYKARKAEALSKLESSKENLQRINDIVLEVRRQLNSLDRQVKKAERFKRLIDELREIELRIARREFLRLSGILAGLTADIELLREADTTKRSELSTAENTLETRRVAVAEKEKEVMALEQTLYEKERSIADSEKEIAVLKTGIENLKGEIARLTALRADREAKRVELSRMVIELRRQEEAHQAHIHQTSDALSEKREATASIESAIAEQEAALEGQRKSLFTISDRLSARRNEHNRLQSSSETLAYKESVALKDKESVIEGLAAAAAGIAETETQISVRMSEVQSLKEHIAQATRDAEALRTTIEQKKNALAAERENLAGNISRLSSLQELIVDKTLRDFLADSGSSLHLSAQVLSDILSAQKDYEAAIEAALSEKVNALMLDNPDDVLTAVDLVRHKKLGRTALFYTGLGSQPFAAAATTFAIASHSAVLGKASDFIRTEHVAAGSAVGHVLDNVYLVRDLRSAIDAFREYPGSPCILATLDGEVISANGFIIAGQGRDILKRKREIKELQKTVSGQQTAVSAAESELLALGSDLAAQHNSLQQMHHSVVEAEKKVSVLQHLKRGHAEEHERRERRRLFLETELTTLTSEKESLISTLTAKAGEIVRIEAEHQAANEALAGYQETLGTVRGNYEQVRSELEDMRLEIASFKEKLISAERERQSTEAAIDEIDEKNRSAADEIVKTETKVAESGTQLQELETSIRAVVEEAARIRQDRQEQRELIDTEKSALLEQETGLRQLRTVIDDLSRRLADVRSSEVEHRMKREAIESGTAQKYGLGIAQAEVMLEGFDSDSDDESVVNLNDKIRDLGPVNLGTLEEYDELKTRHDFLVKQQGDLTMSIAELEEAITRINQTTRRKLREAYEALRAKFSEVFTTLFGGGRADVVLTDEENILEAGLDIIAQPPGKKLQNINLLSGGEKALTSLALLFAGFLLKPSPLCILDEADAPLDESNTLRFSQMIRDLSRETQFVIITHNRTTMEAADYLYGVTMQDPGTSKTISLELSEVENIGVA